MACYIRPKHLCTYHSHCLSTFSEWRLLIILPCYRPYACKILLKKFVTHQLWSFNRFLLLKALVLYGNLGVLGLLILQKHSRRPKSTDYSIFRFIQAVVRFLWDAHNCEEAREEEELVVSTPYIEHWNDLIDLWYLGMQVRES